VPALPKPPGRPQSSAISAEALAAKVDQFLSSRGFKGAAAATSVLAGADVAPVPATPTAGPSSPLSSSSATNSEPVSFVCEDDVRAAIRDGRRIVIGEKTIVTPSARDLGEPARVFVEAGWPPSGR
jgi:hypothetical protein